MERKEFKSSDQQDKVFEKKKLIDTKDLLTDLKNN